MAGMLKLDDFMEQLAAVKTKSESPVIASAILQMAEKLMGTIGADYGLSKEDAYYTMKDFPANTEDKGKREVVSNITTIALDRDNEVVMPEGGIYDDYRDNPVVLWGHQYGQLGVGRNLWIVPDENGMAHKARTRYTSQKANPLGYHLYHYRKEENPLGESIGFIPVEWLTQEDKGYDAIRDLWLERYMFFMQSMGREAPEDPRPDKFFTKWALLEYSDVMVPSNPFAVTVAVEKGLIPAKDVDRYTIKTVTSSDGGGTSGPSQSHSVSVPGTESVNTSAGEVSGGWEAVEIEERDPIERIRLAGLEKAEGGFIPVSTSMWNELCTGVKAANVKTDAYLQHVYGGVIPPDGKWNKSLSDAFDLPVLEEVSSSFRYTLYANYLDCEVKNIYINHYEIPCPLLGTYLDSIQRLTEDFTVHDIRKFSGKGEESPPTTQQIQLKSDLYGEFLVDGTKFCTEEDSNIILDFDSSWYGLWFSIITSAENADMNRKIMGDIHEHASENDMLKGEKFSLSGEFIDPTEEDWEDLIIVDGDKMAIEKSMSGIEDGKSRGLLFAGPPGTGKTMTGRVVMNSTDATFIWVSTRDFGYMASSRIISLSFNMARRLAPTVLFMEDIDSWLGGAGIDAMKIEMDGLRVTRGVMTMLTTNYPERLPKALVDRPGRFHHILLFDLPTVQQRHQMLATWTTGVDKDTLLSIAKETEGLSGAHIRELVDFAESIVEDEGLSMDKALIRSMEVRQQQRELIGSFEEEKGAREIEYTEEEFDLMVKQGLENRRQAEKIKKLGEIIAQRSNDLAEVSAKLNVLQGGVG